MKVRQNYVAELAVRYKNNKSKIRRLINDLSKRKISEPPLIANCLNEHFSSVGENMAKKFERLDNTKDPIDYITRDISNNAANEAEVSKLIMLLQNKKACGSFQTLF